MCIYKKTLIFLLLLCFQPVFAVSSNWASPVFKQYDVSDGLAGLNVTAVLQDRAGMMWFGTFTGLSRFDGYTFTNFNASKDGKGLTHDWVTDLLEDKEGNIWIATKFGLTKFDPRTEIFTHFLHDEKDSTSISNNILNSLFENDDGELWIASGQGLNRHVPETDSFIRYLAPLPKIQNDFHSVTQDRDGNLWLGSMLGGLIKFDRSNNSFEKIVLSVGEDINPNRINKLILDRKNCLWLALNKGGIIEYHIETNESVYHKVGKLQENRIQVFHIDSSGSLWVGLYANGLCKFESGSGAWQCFDQKIQHFPAYNIETLYSSRDDLFWIGTQGQGVVYFKPDHPFKLLRLNKPYNSVSTIERDSQNNLWLGSELGVVKVSAENDITHYQHIANNTDSLNSNSVSYIHKSSDNKIWIATSYGLNLYNPDTNLITPVALKNKQGQTPRYMIAHIMENQSGHLLLATTNNGLLTWHPREQYITEVPIDKDTPGERTVSTYGTFIDSVGRNWVFGYMHLGKFDQEKEHLTLTEVTRGKANHFINMIEDGNGKLWLMSLDNLYEVSVDGKFLSTYNKSLLGNGSLWTMVAANNRLWIGTSNGLSEFDPITRATRHFTEPQGLQSNQFSDSVFLDDDGTVYMGGSDGVTIFKPEEIDNLSINSNSVVLTKLRIHNQAVNTQSISHDSPLTESLTYLDYLELNVAQSLIFSIEFSSLDYFTPKMNQYAYKLEGLMDDWLYTDDSKREATFTALSPGDYVFQVKSSGASGVWSDQSTRLNITILPPWWQTRYAYAAYILLLILSIVFIIKVRTRQFRKQAVILRNEVAERTQEIQGLLKKKNELLANVSHEFRTPLTLILGPIKKLLSHPASVDTQTDLQLIKRNAQRLNGLVEQLLSFSKLSNVAYTQAIPCSVKRVLESTAASLASLMDEHKINLQLSIKADAWVKLSPDDALLTIVSNLLSNAAKYTPAGGEVQLSAFTDKATSTVHIIVRDSGAGIPDEWKDKIFERFSRISEHIKAGIPGTGLGLALIKELVEVNNGQISVSNANEGGAIFEVVLPVYTPVGDETDESLVSGTVPAVGVTLAVPTAEFTMPDQDSHKAMVQIIDDTADMRSFLCQELMHEFNVIMSEDGESGLLSIKQHVPDIIICDIMMPGMDGFEVLQRVRQDECISHIPVILLTAKTGKESELEGLNKLADDYITKPFDRDILLSRITNLLSVRRLLRDYFSLKFMQSEHPHEQYQATLAENEQSFLQRFHAMIEQRFNHDDLNLDEMAESLHVSKRSLQLKLKSVLNQTPREYLITYRIKYAAKLLIDTTLSIGEIQEQSGFSSSSHFARRFKEHFKVSASDYRDQLVSSD